MENWAVIHVDRPMDGTNVLFWLFLLLAGQSSVLVYLVTICRQHFVKEKYLRLGIVQSGSAV